MHALGFFSVKLHQSRVAGLCRKPGADTSESDLGTLVSGGLGCGELSRSHCDAMNL